MGRISGALIIGTLLMVPQAAPAGPTLRGYEVAEHDVALARAKQDGKPVMIYFGEDW